MVNGGVSYDQASNIDEGLVPATGGTTNQFSILMVSADGTKYEVKRGLTGIGNIQAFDIPGFGLITNYNIELALADYVASVPVIYTFVDDGNGTNLTLDTSTAPLFLVENGQLTPITTYDGFIGNTVAIYKDTFNNHYILPIVTKPSLWYVSSSNQSLWQANRTSEALCNQNANDFEEYLELNVTPDITGDYEITVDTIFSHNVTTDNLIIDVDISGDLIDNVIVSIVEMKDSGGTGEVVNVINNGIIVSSVNTSTDIRHPSSKKFIRGLIAGNNYIFKLRWTSQTGNDEATLYNGYLKIELIN